MARMMWIPDELLPGDGRFGSGPAKIRPEALDYLAMRSDIMGTSHRQPPVKQLVAAVQESLAELYRIPAGYEVVLGNGGSTLFWDMAVFSLIEQRSAHGVFGEFSRKFAKAATRAPHLADPAVFEAEAGSEQRFIVLDILRLFVFQLQPADQLLLEFLSEFNGCFIHCLSPESGDLSKRYHNEKSDMEKKRQFFPVPKHIV